MNKNELLSIMVKHGDKNGDVAEYLGITQQSFSNKINEKNSIGFTQVEIMLLKNRYNLSAKQIDNIFFTNRVSYNSRNQSKKSKNIIWKNLTTRRWGTKRISNRERKGEVNQRSKITKLHIQLTAKNDWDWRTNKKLLTPSSNKSFKRNGFD